MVLHLQRRCIKNQNRRENFFEKAYIVCRAVAGRLVFSDVEKKILVIETKESRTKCRGEQASMAAARSQ